MTIIVVSRGLFAGGCPQQSAPISDEVGTRPPARDFYHEAKARREQRELNRDLRDIRRNTAKP